MNTHIIKSKWSAFIKRHLFNYLGNKNGTSIELKINECIARIDFNLSFLLGYNFWRQHFMFFSAEKKAHVKNKFKIVIINEFAFFILLVGFYEWWIPNDHVSWIICWKGIEIEKRACTNTIVRKPVHKKHKLNANVE